MKEFEVKLAIIEIHVDQTDFPEHPSLNPHPCN